jgi:hypothetical protein
MNGVTGIKTDRCLIKPLGMIKVRMAAEDMKVPFALIVPLDLQILGAVSESTATIEYDYETLVSFSI